jgi:hypothetical protein
LNALVKLKTPKQLMNLIIEGQATRFMDDQLAKEDDYAYWLKWVAYEEERNMQQFEGVQSTEIFGLF